MIGVLVSMTIVLSGCGWVVKNTYTSPDKKAAIYIFVPRLLGSSGVSIRFCDARKNIELYTARGDIFLYLTEVYWSPDAKVVGVFTCAAPELRLAVDRQTGGRIAYDSVENALRKRLREKYNIPEWDRDEFKWACHNAGTAEFQGRFGDATQP